MTISDLPTIGISTSAHRHLERQFDQTAHRFRAYVAGRAAARRCLFRRRPKCVDDAFPRIEFEGLGYNVAVHGQKTFNGVAILSKFKFDEVIKGLPGDDSDDHARFIEAAVSTARGAVRIASIYLPNGNPPDTEKYPYKIGWMKRLSSLQPGAACAEEPSFWRATTTSFRSPDDAKNPQAWVGDALSCRPRATNSARCSISA